MGTAESTTGIPVVGAIYRFRRLISIEEFLGDSVSNRRQPHARRELTPTVPLLFPRKILATREN